MPQYEYHCEECRHDFSVYLTLTEKDKFKAACPKCSSKKVRQRFSGFFAKTSRKS